MKVKHLIEELQKIDPELDAGAWMKARAVWSMNTLSFEESGKAIRTLLPILGKPYTNYNHDQSGHRLSHRTVVWKAKTDFQIVACNALTEKGITDFKATDSGYLSINLPYYAFFSSFTTSDDPIVWKQRNDPKEQKLKEKEEVKRQEYLAKQEESKKWMEDYNSPEKVAEREANTKKWQEEQALKKAQEEEKERLVALGMQASKAAEKAAQITVDSVEFNRHIEVEGE